MREHFGPYEVMLLNAMSAYLGWLWAQTCECGSGVWWWKCFPPRLGGKCSRKDPADRERQS